MLGRPQPSGEPFGDESADVDHDETSDQVPHGEIRFVQAQLVIESWLVEKITGQMLGTAKLDLVGVGEAVVAVAGKLRALARMYSLLPVQEKNLSRD